MPNAPPIELSASLTWIAGTSSGVRIGHIECCPSTSTITNVSPLIALDVYARVAVDRDVARRLREGRVVALHGLDHTAAAQEAPRVDADPRCTLDLDVDLDAPAARRRDLAHGTARAPEVVAGLIV